MSLSGDFNPVLVTGGSGFVGACAVEELVNRGQSAVGVRLVRPAVEDVEERLFGLGVPVEVEQAPAGD